jgi:hypothetical protein
MRFKDFLQLEGSFGTTAKLGLYPPLDDALGQYPPLYGTARAADLITYIDIDFKGVNNVPGKNGIIRYPDDHKRRHVPHPAKAAN